MTVNDHRSARTPIHFAREPVGLPEASESASFDLEPAAAFDLRVAPVAKRLGDTTVRMLAYNGSIPGPTLRVRQGSELVVHVRNEADLETTVHWHGLRLENRFDGTTKVQEPIAVGGNFTYRLQFPDPGVYWYHPHVREDYGQELGLYGAIVVVPSERSYWPPVHRELVLVLDDILLEHGQVAPFDRSMPTYTAMGRFGNVLLVNGLPEVSLAARQGEVVRFYLVNSANARTFALALPGARMKLVGGDSGRCEREELVEEVVLAPSERAVVDVLFGQPGRLELEHRTPRRTYPLGTISVGAEPARPSLAEPFEKLRVDPAMTAERQRAARYLDVEPDRTLALVAEMNLESQGPAPGAIAEYVCPMHPDVRSARPDRCPVCHMKLVPAHLVAGAAHEHADGHGHEAPDAMSSGADAPRSHEPGAGSHMHDGGIEWEDDMVDVNRLTTPKNTRWKLVDRSTGAEGAAIDWRFRVGDLVKIRLINEMDSDHPMQHPFHVHGAGRLLVLSRDGVVERNLVWKDTVLVTTGQTVDVLLDVTHPGVWMAHCHIAEHHESGMMLTFRVDP
jgi:FtsP/CotA-like multicopper oxidase with cupredoxin domain